MTSHIPSSVKWTKNKLAMWLINILTTIFDSLIANWKLYEWKWNNPPLTMHCQKLGLDIGTWTFDQQQQQFRQTLFSLVFVGALLGGIGSALLMSQIRPTFLSQNSLRESMGLPILGTVTMNWTANEVIKRKRSLYAFGLSISLLVALYGVVMVFLFLKQ